MENTIEIKKENGKSFLVVTSQSKEGIILTKKGDKTEPSLKRRIVIETIDLKIYEKFSQIEIEVKTKTFCDKIRNLIERLSDER